MSRDLEKSHQLELTYSFTPNKVLSKTAVKSLVFTQVALMVLLWIFFPISDDLSLKAVLIALKDLWFEGLGGHLLGSLLTNVQALFLSIVVSLLFTYASVMPAFRPFVSFFSKLRFLSLGVGMLFFFTLISHSGHELKLYVLVFSVSVFFVTGMADVIESIPKEKFDLARTLRFGEWRVVWEVVVLGQMDKVFDVVRQNAAIGWVMLMTVEAKERSEGGVGALLANQDKHFHLAAVIAIQFTILGLGLVQDYSIGLFKKLCCPYADLTLERR